MPAARGLGPKTTVSAYRVFPALTRFRDLRPRPARLPIGRRPDPNHDDDPVYDAALAINHLYHDLGVLVFAGTTPDQAARIASLLRRVVAAGGPAGLVARLYLCDVGARRRSVLSGADMDPPDGAWDGVSARAIEHHAFVRLGTEQSRAAATEKTGGADARHLSAKRSLFKKAIQAPRLNVHETVNGDRELPVDSFVSLEADVLDNSIMAETHFFLAGTGAMMGWCIIHFSGGPYADAFAARQAGVRSRSKPKLGRTKIQKHMAEQVVEDILEPLWQLEREIWPPLGGSPMETISGPSPPNGNIWDRIRNRREAHEQGALTAVQGRAASPEEDLPPVENLSGWIREYSEAHKLGASTATQSEAASQGKRSRKATKRAARHGAASTEKRAPLKDAFFGKISNQRRN